MVTWTLVHTELSPEAQHGPQNNTRNSLRLALLLYLHAVPQPGTYLLVSDSVLLSLQRNTFQAAWS